MRCDECKYWDQLDPPCQDLGECKKITEIIDPFVDGYWATADYATTDADFFCAAFEGKDDD
jgi:hypothetical protein